MHHAGTPFQLAPCRHAIAASTAHPKVVEDVMEVSAISINEIVSTLHGQRRSDTVVLAAGLLLAALQDALSSIAANHLPGLLSVCDAH